MKKRFFVVFIALLFPMPNVAYGDYCGDFYYNPSTEHCCDGGQDSRVCSNSEVCWTSSDGGAHCIYPCGAGQEMDWYYGTCELCAAGYYQPNSTGTDNSCVACPKFENVSGKTSGSNYSGYDSITDCYIASGSSFSDSTGNYTFASNCYYKN